MNYMLLQVSLWRLQLAFLNKRTNEDCIPFRKEASVIRYMRNVVFNHHGSTSGSVPCILAIVHWTRIFFGMFSLKNKCSFCVLGGVFVCKKRWLLGLRPRPPWGSLQRSPIPPGWAGGRPPPAPSPGDSAI